MEQLNLIVSAISLTMGVAWASGINLYASISMLGILGATGNMVLPPDLQILANPLGIAAAGVMYCVEFFADKVPGLDTGNDKVAAKNLEWDKKGIRFYWPFVRNEWER